MLVLGWEELQAGRLACVDDTTFAVEVVQGLEDAVQNYAEDWVRKSADGVAGKECPNVLPERLVDEALVFAIGAGQLEHVQQ